MNRLDSLFEQIRACRLCEAHLPLGPRPVIRGSERARLLIIGQAPGTRVHASGIPWDDPSGDRLRQWLGVDKATFYDESRIAIMPMGFCYPGKGKSGDLPPRPECAPTWHDKVLMLLPHIELTLLIGQYAQAYYLREAAKGSLTETVRSWADYGPAWLPLPHPSPRNTFWLKKNPWFEQDVIPHLQQRVAPLLG
ncbi:uracil-DNA glycosylase family protein [Aeromonas hydrophila]|uniref:uracil-DNA glycosylase family protein n=1 Tax=Aeromonas TaxID=642 RepID=UPI00111B4EDF|nr:MULTISPECIES: uracil-DNA glycosylase family protein [Aeromonas]MCX4104867.1 uracil-DNA glycosylase family protein [Aeromonas hydrophila]TNJ23067.1 IclR family transcriptional regulator [Aeromonas hydrophila]